MNAVFLDVSKSQGHYVVATDGRHLFSSNSFKLPLKDSLIIPTHRFLGWKEFSNDGEWTLRATASCRDEATRFEIASDHWRFTACSLTGSYPNWRAIVPVLGSTSIEFTPEAAAAVIQTIARMPDHDPVHHAIGLEISGHNYWLLGKSPNAEEWTCIELTPKKVTGPDVKIFLNRQFFIKALRFGLLQINIADSVTPLQFSNGGRQMIVMPIQPEGARNSVASQPSPTPGPMSTPPSPKPVETKKAMPETDRPGTAPENTPESTPATPPKPALDLAISQIETVKGYYRDAIRGLNELTDLLKQAAREQRTSEKEVHSIRQTLRSLQSVRI